MARGRTRRRRKGESPVWSCSICSAQMYGGPRCFDHNPTPEMRQAEPERYARMYVAFGTADEQQRAAAEGELDEA